MTQHYSKPLYMIFLHLSRTSKLIPCTPSIFKVGQIVQAEVSFQAVEVKGKKMRLLASLRSILLLVDIPKEASSLGAKSKELHLQPTTVHPAEGRTTEQRGRSSSDNEEEGRI